MKISQKWIVSSFLFLPIIFSSDYAFSASRSPKKSSPVVVEPVVSSDSTESLLLADAKKRVIDIANYEADLGLCGH